MVYDSVFRVAAFSSQGKLSIFHIEISTPFYNFVESCGSFPYDHFYNVSFVFPISGTHGVFDMLFEIIVFKVGDYGQSALCVFGIAFVFVGFCYDDDLGIRELFRNFNGIGKSRDAGTNY
jgi:hypothetical protein